MFQPTPRCSTRLGDTCSVGHCSPDSGLTSWWARRSGVNGRTAGTRRAGRCSAGAQYHGSARYEVSRAARAHGEVCPCGRGPWRTACKPQSGTNGPAAQCLEHWRNHQHRLWDSQCQDYCQSVSGSKNILTWSCSVTTCELWTQIRLCILTTHVQSKFSQSCESSSSCLHVLEKLKKQKKNNSPPQKTIPARLKLRHMGTEIFRCSHSAMLSPVHIAPTDTHTHTQYLKCLIPVFLPFALLKILSLWNQRPYRSAVSRQRRISPEQMAAQLLLTFGSNPQLWPFAAGCAQDNQWCRKGNSPLIPVIWFVRHILGVFQSILGAMTIGW